MNCYLLCDWAECFWFHESDHDKVAKLLIEKGANVNNDDNDDKWTPLHTAALNGIESFGFFFN